MSNWSLFLKLFYIKSIVTKTKTSAIRQSATQRAAVELFPTAMEKRNEKGRKKKDQWWENHNRMIEVVCEGRRFGDRTNENARDWLWVVLVAWAAKSVSLFVGQDLGSDSTFIPHGRNHGDLWRAHTTCSSQSSETLHVQLARFAFPPCRDFLL